MQAATLQIGEWTFFGSLTVIYPTGGSLSNSTVRLGSAARCGAGASAGDAVLVAAKAVTLDSGPEEIDAMRREHDVLRELGGSHAHILPMLHYEELPGELVLLTRFATAGDLSKHVPRNVCVEEVQVRRLTRQVLSALAFLHGHRVVHGDVKPENMFLTDVEGAMWVQLADFGLSRRVPQGKVAVQLACVQGSHGYIPAEVIHRLELHFASDLFSLGVIVFRYLGGYEPFYPPSKVLDPLIFDEASWRSLTAPCRDLASRALASEPAARGDARGLLEEHAWMTASESELSDGVPGRLCGLRFHDSRPDALLSSDMDCS